LSPERPIVDNVLEMSTLSDISEQSPPGFGRGVFPSLNNPSLSEPDPAAADQLRRGLYHPSEVVRRWVQAGRFLGHLNIADAAFEFPPQLFVVTSRGVKVTIESRPTGAWPQILIVLSLSSYATPVVERFLLRPSGDAVESEVLYTRALYTLNQSGSCFLASEITPDDRLVGVGFGFEPFGKKDTQDLVYRGKLARKLGFIESLFRIRFSVPENITPEQVQRVETLFRGIIEGEFVIRGNAITVPVRAADINLSEPPFAGIGPYEQFLGAEEAVLDHPQLLDVGPIYFSLNKAVVANKSALAPLREGRDQWVRFEVLDSQITYRFERYVARDKQKRVRQKLNQFQSRLEREEPPELAATLTEMLTSDVVPTEAAEIAVGWLEYNNLPDRFSPQEPVLDEERGCWRVPIYLVYAGGDSAPVGELLIDLKTGSVIEEPSPETMYREGRTLAEKVSRVG
jgi:hypothetical protein